MSSFARRFIISVFLFACLLNVSHASTEESCTPIDFRNEFQLKIRDQKKVSWCFAHSAADLLQFTHHLEDQISAADIAILYSKSNASRIITTLKKILNSNYGKIPSQTGFIKIATDLILKDGYCPESVLPSEEWIRISSNGSSSKVEISKGILDLLKLQQEVKNGNYQNPSSLPWYFSFKNIDRERFFDLLEISSSKNLFLKLREFACATDRKKFPSPIQTVFKINTGNIVSRIDAEFESGKPVTIDFFGDVLRNTANPKRSIDELHTVLLYGRKYDPIKQECVYLIKDSYGEQCTKYDHSLECESGYVWMPGKKLNRAATSLLTVRHIIDAD